MKKQEPRNPVHIIGQVLMDGVDAQPLLIGRDADCAYVMLAQQGEDFKAVSPLLNWPAAVGLAERVVRGDRAVMEHPKMLKALAVVILGMDMEASAQKAGQPKRENGTYA